MLNNLLLLSGNDIPFTEAQLSIHQPIIKEIGYIGEEVFFSGCELLNFSKDILAEEDKIRLANMSDFEVFMSIMNDKRSIEAQKNIISANMVLDLLFPNYNIYFTSNIALINSEDNTDIHYITDSNFQQFQKILSEMFCLDKSQKNGEEYNPQGPMARALAEKFKKRKEILAKHKGEKISTKISVLSRYVSILAVGQHKSINDLMQYTVYQLYDEFERFELNQENEYIFRARLAGAKDIDDVDNWMKELHP